MRLHSLLTAMASIADKEAGLREVAWQGEKRRGFRPTWVATQLPIYCQVSLDSLWSLTELQPRLP